MLDYLPNAFGRRAGFDVDINHIFSQCLLAVISLVQVGVGDRGARYCTVCEAELPLCLVIVTALPRLGFHIKSTAGAEARKVNLELALFSLNVLFLFLSLGHLLQRKGVLKQVGVMCMQKSDDLLVYAASLICSL